MGRVLSQTQRDALSLLLRHDGEAVYLSNRLNDEHREIPARTAEVLERDGLIETVDVATIGTCWVAKLTGAGRKAAAG